MTFPGQSHRKHSAPARYQLDVTSPPAEVDVEEMLAPEEPALVCFRPSQSLTRVVVQTPEEMIERDHTESLENFRKLYDMVFGSAVELIC